MSLILPLECRRQPSLAPRINRANPLTRRLTEVVLPPYTRTLIRGYAMTPSSGVTIGKGPGGAAFSMDGGSNTMVVIAGTSTDVMQSTTDCTIFVYRRSRSTGFAASTLFGYRVDNANKCSSHAPYSDGVIYWDFGNISGGRLSVGITKSLQPETLVFIAGGGKGREIWRNGVRIAKSAGADALPADSSQFAIGRAPGDFSNSDTDDIYLFGIASRAWADAEIQSWSRNPWQIFEAPPAVLNAALLASAAGGGAVAAPAERATFIINT